MADNKPFWSYHPDGSMTRKLVQDWTDEEKQLHARHEAFLKEADALGYVIRLDTDTLKWIVLENTYQIKPEEKNTWHAAS